MLAGVAIALGAWSCARREEPLRDAAPQHQTSATPHEPNRNASWFEERRTDRERLVARQLETEGITDPRVLAAMRKVPRHRFVPERVRDDAYLNQPLPIGWGQTISQPFIVALMTQVVRIQPQDRCLEIGTGSGYQAAILAELCVDTYSIEYLPQLARFAESNLRALGYGVHLRTGDGALGWPEAAPFDVIVVTAAPETVPPRLLDQLAVGGRLIVPVGSSGSVQQLESWTRVAPGKGRTALARRKLDYVRFVPLLGNGAER